MKTKCNKCQENVLSDHVLIQLAMQGDNHAFGTIMQRYDRLVQFVVRRYLNNQQAIIEATQDTFIKAFRNMHNFRGDCKLGTWLGRIAVSQAINYLRREGRHQHIPIEEAPVHMHTDDFRIMEQAETRKMLEIAMRNLTEQDAIALDLFYFREQSVEEICRITGWSNVNVRSRLTRARTRLRGVLEGSPLLNEVKPQ